MMISSNRILRVSLIACILLWLAVTVVYLRIPFKFDDAYMFYRYAMHMHAGAGISWNLDGGHTFGETSLLWGWFIWLLTFLPLPAGKLLQLASCISAGAACGSLAAAVAMNARSRTLGSISAVLPFVVIPLIPTTIFLRNMGTGMETMLAFALISLYGGMVLRWSRAQTHWSWLFLVGFCCVWTRPESGLLVVLMPALAALLRRDRMGWRDLCFFALSFAAALAAALFLCGWYFGSMLPLPFLLKSLHGYRGAVFSSSNPVTDLLAFLGACLPFLVAWTALARRFSRRAAIVCWLPIGILSLYLLTVVQIMGTASRYYLPGLGLAILPALLALDEAFEDHEQHPDAPFIALSLRWGLAVAGVVVLGSIIASQAAIPSWNPRILGRPIVYTEPLVHIDAPAPLPAMDRDQAIDVMARDIARQLPAGTSIAATEVGYLGAMALEADIIDTAGLNDSEIARHGFNPDELLDRKPDLIWISHFDYTWDRGALMSSPRFLEEYTFYDRAFAYGLAVRKDSPRRGLIDPILQRAWARSYPGTAMDDYIARSVVWDQKTCVGACV